MPTTLEVRWFHEGRPPAEIQHWIEALGGGASRAWTDVYLPSQDTGLNLKVRDEKLQIKRRTAGPTTYTLRESIAGRCERWVKWSFDLATSAVSLENRSAGALWVPVEKSRRRVSLPVGMPDSRLASLPETPEVVILVEVTELSAAHETAWTLCLEAEGPADQLEHPFGAAGRELLPSDPTVDLTEATSYGYVRWLQDLPGITPAASEDISLPLQSE